MDGFALTTFDNPYSPFTEFDLWQKYDEEKGYFTCSYLARIATPSISLSEDLNNEEIKSAMEEICSYNPTLYTIVFSNKEYTFPLSKEFSKD